MAFWPVMWLPSCHDTRETQISLAFTTDALERRRTSSSAAIVTILLVLMQGQTTWLFEMPVRVEKR